jgi:histidinol-phosphate/aromatic aminotransferase/cobyric acid decarboxylase-like protein
MAVKAAQPARTQQAAWSSPRRSQECLRFAEPQGNFVFFDTGLPHARFADLMKAEHVIVGRKFAPYDNWCRITVGTEPEVDWILKSLRKVIAKGL